MAKCQETFQVGITAGRLSRTNSIVQLSNQFYMFLLIQTMSLYNGDQNVPVSLGDNKNDLQSSFITVPSFRGLAWMASPYICSLLIFTNIKKIRITTQQDFCVIAMSTS